VSPLPALGSSEGHGPLSGVTVLDLSGYVAGPYGCALLGDLGALVLKIEPPEGDNLRNYPSTLPGESRAFLGSIATSPASASTSSIRAAWGAATGPAADVLVHNFRPSVPARLGIDYDGMRALNERLIYCTLTGYGDRGPLKDRAGYDQVLQTMTGIAVEQGKPGDPEIVYGSAVDFYSASMLAFAVSSALFERGRTGRGQYVSVSLLRSALAMQATRLVWAEGEGRDVARDMRSGGITGLHPTRSGSLYISANTPHFWRALCELIGLPELATDPRFDTVRKRAEHAAALVPRLRRGAAGAHRGRVGGAHG
jgi:formyl-CoA transferase